VETWQLVWEKYELKIQAFFTYQYLTISYRTSRNVKEQFRHDSGCKTFAQYKPHSKWKVDLLSVCGGARAGFFIRPAISLLICIMLNQSTIIMSSKVKKTCVRVS
jgi:hypothetical protein